MKNSALKGALGALAVVGVALIAKKQHKEKDLSKVFLMNTESKKNPLSDWQIRSEK
jgi:hypothetical protein